MIPSSRPLPTWLETLAERQGDLIYDISQSLLWNPVIAPHAYRSIFRQILRQGRKERFERYERPWVLSIAVEVLARYAARHPVRITPSEQVMLDSNPNPKSRLRHFDSYFHRLPFKSQAALLLMHKYKLEPRDVCATLGLPIPSLELQIEQSLRQLEDWIWSEAPSDPEAHRKEMLELIGDQSLSIRSDDLKFNPLKSKWRTPTLKQDWKKIWNELPAPIRLLAESGLIVVGMLVLIQLTPRLRLLYEQHIDRRLQGLIESESQLAANLPLSRGRSETADPALHDSEYSEEAELESDHDQIKVGRSEIWRFNVKTDSPAIMRGKIIQAFQMLGLPQETPGMGGIEAPGGIQFDILVPQSAVPGIKQELEKLIPDLPAQGYNELFTWYKNRSKKPIPSGYSRVVIWLSQI